MRKGSFRIAWETFGVLETSARLLRLLSLLQSRPEWTGPELAERLGVTTRTIRNDVTRLRNLGYPVDAAPGTTGGYRLGVGAALPPLLLDDDEAVAVAVGLRTAAGGTVTGIEETSVRALAKLEQVLPARLRHRVNALQTATVPIPRGGPTVSAAVLTALAAACREHHRLRFDYVNHDGSSTVRETEPHRVVHTRGRWYLVAWDVDRADWRTFRADRITPRTPAGRRFVPREPPEGDVARFVSTGVATAMWRLRVRVLVHAPAAEVVARLPVGAGTVSPVDAGSCTLDCGADTPHQLALYLGLLDADFTVTEPAELVEQLRTLAARVSAGDRVMSRRARATRCCRSPRRGSCRPG
jgi:predicted DNA-binding transcriptional regulator YafY